MIDRTTRCMIFSLPGLFGDYFNLKSLKPSLKGHMASLKVKYRFVDFFAMVPSSLFEIQLTPELEPSLTRTSR